MENGIHAQYFNNTYHGDDAYLTRVLNPTSVLDAVFDGVSTGIGSKASQLMVEKLKSKEILNLGDIVELLKEANDELFKATNGVSLTTATIALKIDNQLCVLNVGDSPAYLLRYGGITELTTLDKGKNPEIITHAVGEGKEFSYHINKVFLQPNDKLVLVTDGISDNIHPQEIAEIVYKENTPNGVVDKLDQLLKKKRASNSGRDDVFGRYKNDDTTSIIRYFLS